MSRVVLIRKEIAKISEDEGLINDMEKLPKNYNFEIPKTIWKIRSTNSKFVCLQFPEGLLLFACTISDILRRYTDCETVIAGDVTYGACCISDQSARVLGCDLIVHYGHSCLVPIQETDGIEILYVFVDIEINLVHLVDIVSANFKQDAKLALVSTIQFVPSLQKVKKILCDSGFNIDIPQVKPLSPGEVIGCTSPVLPDDTHAIIYIGDGRFHLESIMIQNPSLHAYQYDPYSDMFTCEEYDFEAMIKQRKEAIDKAKNATVFGLIQGSLGRQGSPKILQDLESRLLKANKKVIRVLLSEITEEKLSEFQEIDCWVQIACPRLSIDWGAAFLHPLLTPYELVAALDDVKFRSDWYPMDYYANESLGPWTNNNIAHRVVRPRRPHVSIVAGK